MQADRRPSVLMLLPDLPAPASTGGQVRAFHFLQGLIEIADVTACILPDRKHGCLPGDVERKCVRVLQPDTANQDHKPVRGNSLLRVLSVLAAPWRQHGRSLMMTGSSLCVSRAEASKLTPAHRWYAGLLTTMALWLGGICRIYPSGIHFRNQGLNQVLPMIHGAFAARSPDVIWCEHSYLYPIVDQLHNRYPNALLIVNTHNVETQLKLSIAGTMKSQVAKAWLIAESRNLNRWECHMLRQASLVYCCSTQDADRYRKMCPDSGARLAVVPNGVDTHYFHSLPYHPGAPTVLFAGTAGYPPNDDAVPWLVKEIMPLVRQQIPGVELVLAGRNAVGHWGKYLNDDPQSKIASDVPDMRLWLEKANVCVVPVRSGSGTRLKILEAMSSGRPVVSTQLGAEGAEVVDGQHLLLADTPSEFAAAIVGLLNDSDKCGALVNNGRNLVEDLYDWDVLIARAMHTFRTITASRTARETSGVPST